MNEPEAPPDIRAIEGREYRVRMSYGGLEWTGWLRYEGPRGPGGRDLWNAIEGEAVPPIGATQIREIIEMRASAPHVVYPEGPTCSPDCPGPWSQYHDGYADGYERAEQEAKADREQDATWRSEQC